MTREAIAAQFAAVLRRRFGSGHSCEYDLTTQRYVVISPSAAGRPCRQFVVWYQDPHTGQPNKADVLGLLPFRELDAACQADILEAMDRTSLTNRHDGAQTWDAQARRVLEHNEAVTRAGIREAAELFALGLTEVDLRRPWLKHHTGSSSQRRIAWGGTRHVF